MNRLYYGDNLTVLRGCIGDESVDLIYLDPPFNSQATYNVLFRSTAGEKSRAQIEAFEDTWHWGDEAELLGPAQARCGCAARGERMWTQRRACSCGARLSACRRLLARSEERRVGKEGR